MCLFKKRDFKEANTLNSLVGAGIFAIILAIVLPFITAPNENLASKFALAQLSLSSVGFILIIVTLCFTIVQLRKSNAKPKIKVAFNEEGEQSFTLTYKDNKPAPSLPLMSLINDGNAIARCFQIDFVIPKSVSKDKLTTKDSYGNGIYTYINDEKKPLFVKKPSKPVDLSITYGIDNRKYLKYTKPSFTVKYRIYGDWNEIQEGKLTIRLQKQKEVA